MTRYKKYLLFEKCINIDNERDYIFISRDRITIQRHFAAGFYVGIDIFPGGDKIVYHN